MERTSRADPGSEASNVVAWHHRRWAGPIQYQPMDRV
jgi:hypothetical protein